MQYAIIRWFTERCFGVMLKGLEDILLNLSDKIFLYTMQCMKKQQRWTDLTESLFGLYMSSFERDCCLLSFIGSVKHFVRAKLCYLILFFKMRQNYYGISVLTLFAGNSRSVHGLY